jgi:hypothetical protein
MRARGRYKLPLLVAQYGPNEKLFTFMHEIAADRPGKQARSDNDSCGAIFSDLPKLL